MAEKIQGREKNSFSEDEVKKAQDLIKKVREVVEWDLGSMCSTTEEIDMVHKAKDAMKEVEALFHVPALKRWVDFSGKDAQDCFLQAVNYNTAILPSEALVLDQADGERLRVHLEAIQDVIGWDMSAHDEGELKMMQDAKESLDALMDMV